MTTIRSEKRGNFTIIPNALIEDTRLSPDGRFLMIYLLSKPDDWQVRLYDLMNSSGIGLRRARRILRELARLGYLRRNRVRQDDGTFVWEATVVEQPRLPTIGTFSIDGASTGGSSIGGSSIGGSSIGGKPVDILSTELTNTESQKTEGTKKEGTRKERTKKKEAKKEQARTEPSFSSSSFSSSSSTPINTDPPETPLSGQGEETQMRFAANLQAMRRAGIREPAASRLARLPHVTPGYVAAHVRAAREKGLDLGTVVSRMQQGWGPPESASRGRRTVQEQIDRFLRDRRGWNPPDDDVQPSESAWEDQDPPQQGE